MLGGSEAGGAEGGRGGAAVVAAARSLAGAAVLTSRVLVKTVQCDKLELVNSWLSYKHCTWILCVE